MALEGHLNPTQSSASEGMSDKKSATKKFFDWWGGMKESISDSAESAVSKGVTMAALHRAARYIKAHPRELSIGAAGGILGASALVGLGVLCTFNRSARIAVLTSAAILLVMTKMPEVKKGAEMVTEKVKDAVH